MTAGAVAGAVANGRHRFNGRPVHRCPLIRSLQNSLDGGGLSCGRRH